MSKLVRLLGIGTAFGLGCLTNYMQSSADETETMQEVSLDQQKQTCPENRIRKEVIRTALKGTWQTDLDYLNNQLREVVSENKKQLDLFQMEESRKVREVYDNCVAAIVTFQNKTGIRAVYDEYEGKFKPASGCTNPPIGAIIANLWNELDHVLVNPNYQFNPNAEQ